MSSDLLSELLASKVDNRSESIRYRQDQLQKLHKQLIDHGDQIREALQKDTGYTPVECEVEFILGVNVVRDHYNSLDFKSLLKGEYKIAESQDAADRKVGVGIVSITPSKRSPFFSLIAPVSAALAAGNALLIKIEQDLRYLSPILRSALSTLDPDTVVVTGKDTVDQDFLAQAVVVNQEPAAANSSSSSRPARNVLQSPQSQRVIAVVDRTADLELAASSLVQARFSFRGQSVYAPDLVLVNEFVQQRFLKALGRYVTEYSGDAERGSSLPTSSYKNLLKEIEDDPAASLSIQVKHGLVVQLSSRSSPLLQAEVNAPVLLVAPVTSLDDAINWASFRLDKKIVPGDEALYMALYVFAAPPTAKYISQFIDAQASFVNKIPSELLVGPPAPVTSQHGISISHRYEPSMFQLSRPQFIQEPGSSALHSQVLWTENKTSKSGPSQQSQLRQKLLDEATRPLQPTGQALLVSSIGFFEQGILVGLSLSVTSILLTAGLGGYYGGGYVWRHLVSQRF